MCFKRLGTLLFAIFSLNTFLICKSNSLKIANVIDDLQTITPLATTPSPPEIIRKLGYPAETHTVQSSDGYLLEMHRIPHGKDVSKAANKQFPVLLHHGILCTSLDWIRHASPDTSLAYSLADAGYDVWMANTRGNAYSRRHISLNVSFHELGYYDAPAMIDYILSETKSKKLVYIGHSLGTTVFYVMASTRSEYNSKIKLQISLGPTGSLAHTKIPSRHMVPFAEIYYGSVPWVTANLGATSGKNMIHCSQLIRPGKFAQYDYGATGNMEHYQAIIPPPYNISLISAPVAFYYAEHDFISDPLVTNKLRFLMHRLRMEISSNFTQTSVRATCSQDAKLLYQQLPNPMGLNSVKEKNFSHMDFMRSRSLNEQLVQLVGNDTTSDSKGNDFIKRMVTIAREIREKTSPPVDVPVEEPSILEKLNDMLEGYAGISSINITELNNYTNTVKETVLGGVENIRGMVSEAATKVNAKVQNVIGNVLDSTRTAVQDKIDEVNQMVQEKVSHAKSILEKYAITLEQQITNMIKRISAAVNIDVESHG